MSSLRFIGVCQYIKDLEFYENSETCAKTYKLFVDESGDSPVFLTRYDIDSSLNVVNNIEELVVWN